eukprot:Skav227525  [mRNA]  locus=scaffold2269:186932:189378:- [translate_table: standard]
MPGRCRGDARKEMPWEHFFVVMELLEGKALCETATWFWLTSGCVALPLKLTGEQSSAALAALAAAVAQRAQRHRIRIQ